MTSKTPRKPISIPIEKAKLKEPKKENLTHQINEIKPKHESNPEKKKRQFLSIKKLISGSITGLILVTFVSFLENLIQNFIARSDLLGWLGLAFALSLIIGLLFFLIKEFFALKRLQTIEHLQKKAKDYKNHPESAYGKEIVQEIIALYEKTPHTAHARNNLHQHTQTILNTAEYIERIEKDLLEQLDKQAIEQISASARRISLITAISPRAFIDIGFVIVENIRLLKKLSTLYGTRPGSLSRIKLAKKTLSHLAITTGLAAGDTMISQFIGHGIAGKVSTRLGEGMINGILTGRIGLALIESIRPIPFTFSKKPNLSQVTRSFITPDKKSHNNKPHKNDNEK